MAIFSNTAVTVLKKFQCIKKMAQNYERRLHNHPNTEAIQLLNYREATRRLNRTKPLELLVRVVIRVKSRA
jgi:hypothetical protein